MHAVADRGAVLGGVNKDSSHCAGSDVDHVVDGPTTVGKSSDITGEEAKTLLACHGGGRNSRVEAKQIGDWAGVTRAATGAEPGIRDIRPTSAGVEPLLRGADSLVVNVPTAAGIASDVAARSGGGP